MHEWSSTPTRDLVSYVLGISLPSRVSAAYGPHGLVEVRISGSEAEIESPVPVLVVREDGSETAPCIGKQHLIIR